MIEQGKDNMRDRTWNHGGAMKDKDRYRQKVSVPPVDRRHHAGMPQQTNARGMEKERALQGPRGKSSSVTKRSLIGMTTRNASLLHQLESILARTKGSGPEVLKLRAKVASLEEKITTLTQRATRSRAHEEMFANQINHFEEKMSKDEEKSAFHASMHQLLEDNIRSLSERYRLEHEKLECTKALYKASEETVRKNQTEIDRLSQENEELMNRIEVMENEREKLVERGFNDGGDDGTSSDDRASQKSRPDKDSIDARTIAQNETDTRANREEDGGAKDRLGPLKSRSLKSSMESTGKKEHDISLTKTDSGDPSPKATKGTCSAFIT